uniref:Putative endoplasmic reticulum membrane protein n=1 Tax=Talaromyces marneffei PM1 TaxID=1077442 RepID=A0A093XKN3_TALMA
MWHTLKLLLPCLAVVAAPHQTISSFTRDVVREDIARLFLQQRILSTESTTPTNQLLLARPVLELLNIYGGNQYSLFQDVPISEQQKLLVVVEGILKDNTAIAPKTPNTALNMRSVSTDFVDSILMDTISEWKHCEYGAKANDDVQKLQSCLYQHPTFIGSPQRPITQLLEGLPLSSLEAWSDAAGSREILRLRFNEHLSDATTATQFLTSLSSLFDNYEQTILLVPQQQEATSSTRKSPIKKNVYPTARPRLHSQSRRSQSVNAASSDYLSTLMPVCHSTNDTCTSSTNACSGHGVCYLKSAGVKDNDCYACKCDSEWGGPACQKVDISTQFFLIGTVSVLAILAVGGGIGLLFSVGQEELPSVISAGVSSVKVSR